MSQTKCLAATGCKGDRGCRRGEPPGRQGRRSCQECRARRPGSHIHGTTTSHFDITGSFPHSKSTMAALCCCCFSRSSGAQELFPQMPTLAWLQTLSGIVLQQSACGNAAATSQCLLTIDTVANSFPDLTMQHAWLIFTGGCTMCAAGGGSSRCSWGSS